MNTTIYYFSGTGNSLIVAKYLAEKVNGKLVPIASVVNQDKILIDSDITGIVFPVYNIEHDCIPLIITRFISKFANMSGKYIFSICTYGGGAYKTFDNVNKLLKLHGGKLSAGFGIQMPQNAFHNKIFNNNDKMYKICKKKIGVISNHVLAKRTNSLDDFRNILTKLIMGPIIKKEQLKAELLMRQLSKTSSSDFSALMLYSDNSYYTDERCNGCGICKKVCPVHNIEIISNKPKWSNRCETCLACFHWCPQKAIHGGMVSLSDDEGYRYHHPEITVKDMMIQSSILCGEIN